MTSGTNYRHVSQGEIPLLVLGVNGTRVRILRLHTYPRSHLNVRAFTTPTFRENIHNFLRDQGLVFHMTSVGHSPQRLQYHSYHPFFFKEYHEIKRFLVDLWERLQLSYQGTTLNCSLLNGREARTGRADREGGYGSFRN